MIITSISYRVIVDCLRPRVLVLAPDYIVRCRMRYDVVIMYYHIVQYNDDEKYGKINSCVPSTFFLYDLPYLLYTLTTCKETPPCCCRLIGRANADVQRVPWTFLWYNISSIDLIKTCFELPDVISVVASAMKTNISNARAIAATRSGYVFATCNLDRMASAQIRVYRSNDSTTLDRVKIWW